MKLRAVNAIASAVDGVTGFTGYNHASRIGNTEFYDQRNISSDLLPVVTQRARRGRVRALTKANALFSGTKLGWVDGTTLYYDGAAVGTVTDSEKKIIRMGAYILIWPDKAYYNTATATFGSLENTFTAASGVSAALCRATGTLYEYTVADEAPATPSDGEYWLDTSGDTDYLRIYSTSKASWSPVETVYVKISCTGIGAGFSVYDGVTIAGMDNDELNGSFYLVDVGDNSIVVTAIIREAIAANTGTLSVVRAVPDMDYMTEYNNRIWGCSSEHNELYACALGDPKNWNQFMGISTDSYAVNVGSAGAFTGAASIVGYVYFFKEDRLHQVMGSTPSTFSVEDIDVRGVATGAEGSMCVVNEMLYYQAPFDICSFWQSSPVTISDALGDVRYRNGVGGALNGKYYLCLEDSSGTHALFVYDTSMRLWCKEDATHVRWFSRIGDELYFVSGNTIYSVNGTISEYGDDDAALEAPVEWMLETGDIGADIPFNKYIAGISLRAEAAIGATIRVEIQYDANGAWNEVYRSAPTTPSAMTVPITTQRCRTMKLRLLGEGSFKLWSLTRRITVGSDVL